MQLSSRSDQELLGATDASSFEEFYLRHVNTLLGYFADARRKGYAERRMCRRLGMERIDLTDADIAHIEELGESGLLEGLPEAQAAAVRAHVVEERDYGEIAGELHTSEAVVRKRVSRGLATARRRIGRHP